MEINFYNSFHLGDHVFNVHFLNKYKNYNIKFNYYVYSRYFNEIKNFIKNKNINICSLDQIQDVPANAYNLWIGYENFYYNEISKHNFMYDLFYVNYFNKISSKFNLDIVIKNNFDLLFDNDNPKIDLKKTYDFLIINSIPLSKQFNYNEEEFIKLCTLFEKNNITFITTKKIKNYECTLDYNMSLIDIGHLSNSCRNVIAVNTSPIITTFTIQNINKVDKRFVLDNFLKYSYNERICNLQNLSLIYKLL